MVDDAKTIWIQKYPDDPNRILRRSKQDPEQGNPSIVVQSDESLESSLDPNNPNCRLQTWIQKNTVCLVCRWDRF